jgi:predicted 3-demethylubiquinone-9 3-methyltransferase (glyoxalase superfamily)
MMQKITPCLWFDGQGEEAMNFYVSVFKDAKVLSTSPGPDGKVLTGTFQLAGQTFMALNGGPQFNFNEAISLSVACKDQAEVDYYWERLTADGGAESMCGWLKDKYGLSWQIIPDALMTYLGGADREGAQRATQAMLGMRKIDIEGLRRAYEGEAA